MIVEILIFLVTTLCAYLLYIYKCSHDYFKEKGVRYLPGVPIFGNVFYSTFSKKHGVHDLDTVYKAFPDDKYVGFFDFAQKILMIRDPEIIKNITIKDFDHFVNHRQFFSPETDPLFTASLFLMKDERWRDMRATLSPAFTSNKMRLMLPLMEKISDNILNYLHDHITEDFDIDDLIRRYTNDVIASAGFGLEVNSLVDRDNEFYSIGTNIFNFTFWQTLRLSLFALFPALEKKIKMQIFPEKTYQFFRNIVSSTMEYRKTKHVDRPDMIQLLMETPKDWTPDELVGQVFLFFIAGFETSASAITLTIHELAVNPDVQDRLYQEIKTFQKTENSLNDLNEMKYLECVVNETLRKWSPAIQLDRMCVKDYELPPPREGGKPYTVKKGDIVYNMANCIQMDPQYYPNPDVFDPDRFSDENKHNIQACTFTPFGSGPRICIGSRFAMLEIKILMYKLLSNFKIVKCEKTVEPLELAHTQFKIQVLGGTWVRFEKRE